MLNKTVLCVLATLLLGGCAGHHNIPPSDFYTSNISDRTVRIVLDQDGSFYPTTQNHPVYKVKPSWWCNFRNCGWQLHKLKDKKGSATFYDFDNDYNNVAQQVIDDLKKTLKSTHHLVVLIHGFNNNFADALENYKLIRKAIDKDKEVTFLEVYWDGLDHFLQPFSFWADSLTYSNLAGQIGLRKILNGIDLPIELTFVTHSRGAAVAISAISDPIYDDTMCAPQEGNGKKLNVELCRCHLGDRVKLNTDFPRFSAFNDRNFNSINLVMFAAAVGKGHFWQGTDIYFQNQDKIGMFIGTNKRDFATNKLLGNHENFGDTSMGGNQPVIDEIMLSMDSQQSRIHIQQLIFKKGFYHGLSEYFGEQNSGKPECMMWAGHLRAVKPADCSIDRVN